jgi:hypothetical protein
MSLRTGHGNGKGQPRVEVLPVDELPAPLPAVPVQVARRSNGTVADSQSAKALGRRGGLAKAGSVRLVDSLGLSKLADEARFHPYREAAEGFVKAHLASLAAQAGGEVGTGPSTMVASAGLQLAASRFCFDLGAEKSDPALMKLGSALANDSRQNLLAAYELAVREAKSGAAHERLPWMVYEDDPPKTEKKP